MQKILINISLIAGAIAVVWVLASAVDRTMSTKSEMIKYTIAGESSSRSLVSEDDLKVIMDRDFNDLLVGASVSEVDVKAIENRLMEEPYLEKTDVYLDAKGILHIDVRPREAMFRVMTSKGKSYFIDKNGISFPLSRHYTPRVQIVTGYVSEYKGALVEESDSVLKQIFEIMSYITKDKFLNAQIEELYVRQDGLIELIPKVGNHRIIYGKHSSDDMVDRLENLKIFYRDGLPFEGWNKYSSINIEYKGQVVCSK